MSQAHRKSLLVGSALLAVFALSPARPATAHGRDFADIAPPTGAHPGQCFAKVREPDAVERTAERVLIKPAGSVTHTVPAVTRVVEKTVVVAPASEQTITHPAVRRSMRRAVLVPGPADEVESPARYRLVTRRVLVEAAHTVWKRGAGRPVTGEPSYGQVAYEATGEVMCRVVVPARYAVRTERVEAAPAGHRTVRGPAVVRHLREDILISPERVEVLRHPAVTRVVRETEVVSPARTETVAVPAQYRTVERARTTPRYGWQLVVCAPKPAPRSAPRPAPGYQPLPYVAPQDMVRPAYGERG